MAMQYERNELKGKEMQEKETQRIEEKDNSRFNKL